MSTPIPSSPLQLADLNKEHWHPRLYDLVEVVEAAYMRELRLPQAKATQFAKLAVIAIASQMGGKMIYIPQTRQLEKELRKLSIRMESKHLTPRELADKHGLTVQTVYSYLAHQP